MFGSPWNHINGCIYYRLDDTECAQGLGSFLLMKHKDMQMLLLGLYLRFTLVVLRNQQVFLWYEGRPILREKFYGRGINQWHSDNCHGDNCHPIPS